MYQDATASAYMEASEQDYGLMSENKRLSSSKVEQRHIIRSAYLKLAVKEPTMTPQWAESQCKSLNGYVERTTLNSMTLRVPAEQFDTLMSYLRTLGKIKSENINAQDVSGTYKDLTIRLENSQRARARYLELLEQAEDVTSALLVEKELERLNQTIDMLQGSLNEYDDTIRYSRITMDFYLKKKLGLIGYIGTGLYEGTKWLFVRN